MDIRISQEINSLEENLDLWAAVFSKFLIPPRCCANATTSFIRCDRNDRTIAFSSCIGVFDTKISLEQKIILRASVIQHLKRRMTTIEAKLDALLAEEIKCKMKKTTVSEMCSH